MGEREWLEGLGEHGDCDGSAYCKATVHAHGCAAVMEGDGTPALPEGASERTRDGSNPPSTSPSTTERGHLTELPVRTPLALRALTPLVNVGRCSLSSGITEGLMVPRG